MPHKEPDLLAVNRAQSSSEVDDFTEERYAQFVRHLPPNAKAILDVGCNTGRGGAVLRRLLPGMKIDGLDCVQERLDAIAGEIYDRRICSFTNAIDLESGSYDAIVAGEFLEHVPSEQVYSTLCEFFRLLRLRGRLMMTTPNPRCLKNQLKNLSVLLDPSHVTQHFPERLGKRLMDIGFSHIAVLGSGRMSRKLGAKFPILAVYGSYLVLATKW
jgi:2-polyprenyl-3-methyl-5-hydroxy-6-metoxy-1,4-benzoquinol methylase